MCVSIVSSCAPSDRVLLPTSASLCIVMCEVPVVTVCLYPKQTLQKEGLSVLEQTLVQFLSRYFGVEEPGSDLLQQIVLEG